MSTLYASFIDASAAERATGALLDQGADANDISVVANEAYNSVTAVTANAQASDAEQAAKTGISTTTPADVGTGALKGATIGLGVGIAAVIASVFVPGIGLILGGGALATALAGGAATVAAGTLSGGVVGYLRDQGIPEEVVTHYNDHFLQGGAILAIAVPSGELIPLEVESILAKYGATNIATYNSAKVLVDNPAVSLPHVPLNVDNPRIDPISKAPLVEAVTVEPAATVTRVVDSSTGESRLVARETPAAVIDPVTGVVTSDIAPDPLAPSVVTASGVVIDPNTGLGRPATVTELATGETTAPADAEFVAEDDEVPVIRKNIELH
jgi:hypothetical protein